MHPCLNVIVIKVNHNWSYLFMAQFQLIFAYNMSARTKLSYDRINIYLLEYNMCVSAG